jgi:Protein of unknown function (DUF3500)
LCTSPSVRRDGLPWPDQERVVPDQEPVVPDQDRVVPDQEPVVTVSPRTFGIRNTPALSGRRPFAADGAQLISHYGEAGRQAMAEPFVGITTDGHVRPGLFSLQPTGVTTDGITAAAEAFLDSLGPERSSAALFGVEDDVWRAWSNIHPFVMRHGVALDDCTPGQRERALDLLRATCSARGFELARNVMRLNDALAEITGRDDEYGEWLYWLSIMGTPSREQPWGWQLDGHHLVVNCFVLGDQVVMTPSFFGSEPTAVETGRHAGLRVFEEEDQRGLEFVRSLSAAQRAVAMPASTDGVLRAQRMDGRIQAAAFRDNIQLSYAGLAAGELDAATQARLLDLVGLYVGRMADGHARVKLAEVERYLSETHFVWVGGIDDESVFYYRVHSPVILIEFDHLNGIAFDNDEPSRNHIHTVVRTPNGNDYGKDLLRQHYSRHHR